MRSTEWIIALIKWCLNHSAFGNYTRGSMVLTGRAPDEHLIADLHLMTLTANQPQRFVRSFIEKPINVKSVGIGLKNPSLHWQHSLFINLRQNRGLAFGCNQQQDR